MTYSYVLIAFVIFSMEMPPLEDSSFGSRHLPTMNIVAEFNDFEACNFARGMLNESVERTNDPRLPSWENAIFVSINCYPKGVRP